MSPVNVTSWGDTGDRVLCVHGSFGWGTETFRKQRPLANSFRLVLVDRRGFGRTPADGRVDFDRDADDLALLLDEEPAHLLGHSYGGVVALLAAARRPERVRSLAVIEPPALGLARGNPAVEEFIATVGRAQREAADPSDYRVRFWHAFGFRAQVAQLEGDKLVAATASFGERSPAEAEIPLEELAAAPFPKLVIRGGWDEAPPEARGRGGAALHAVCDVLERELRAASVVMPGGAHNPQLLGGPFNEPLAAFWRAA